MFGECNPPSADAKVEKNVCLNLLELINPSAALEIEPQAPSDPKPSFPGYTGLVKMVLSHRVAVVCDASAVKVLVGPRSSPQKPRLAGIRRMRKQDVGRNQSDRIVMWCLSFGDNTSVHSHCKIIDVQLNA